MRRRRAGHGRRARAAVLSHGSGGEEPGPEVLARQVVRAADRLRELGPARLSAAGDERGASVAQVALETARELARAAERLEARAERRAEVDRAVPLLAVHAVGDQVAVTGHDLLAALRAEREPDVRRDVAAAATSAVRRLRDALP